MSLWKYFLYIYRMWTCYAKVKVAQSCLTLCDSMDYTVLGILQARIMAWVAFPFSRGSSQPRDRTLVSRIAGGFFTNWATREACYTNYLSNYYYLQFPGGSDGKESACNVRNPCLIPGSGRSPGEGNGYSLQYSGEFHGQRSLVGYSSWSCKELDTTETH